MRIAIMQPTYLPWTGYFALVDQVDYFVLLDDVQFSRQSWQQRNRVNTYDGPKWLTVPVLKKGRGRQLINEVEINNNDYWERKHLTLIKNNYSKAPWLPLYDSWLEMIYQQPWTSLYELNATLIKEIAAKLGLEKPFVQASSLGAAGKKTSRLIDICKLLEATEYLSPIGSFEYIDVEENPFPEFGIELLYQQYEHPTYQQMGDQFYSHLSTIDLLLNEGTNSLEIIRSGERSPYTHEEVRALKASEQTEEEESNHV